MNNYYYRQCDENGQEYFINVITGTKKRWLNYGDVEVEGMDCE